MDILVMNYMRIQQFWSKPVGYEQVSVTVNPQKIIVNEKML